MKLLTLGLILKVRIDQSARGQRTQTVVNDMLRS